MIICAPFFLAGTVATFFHFGSNPFFSQCYEERALENFQEEEEIDWKKKKIFFSPFPFSHSSYFILLFIYLQIRGWGLSAFRKMYPRRFFFFLQKSFKIKHMRDCSAGKRQLCLLLLCCKESCYTHPGEKRELHKSLNARPRVGVGWV